MCFVSVSAFSQIKDGFTKSENGVFYKVEKANPNGRAVKQGDIVVCNYSASYGDSLVFTNFNQEPIPTFAVSDQSRAFKGDMIDGLQLMKEGETYSFAFPYDSLAKMQKLPAFFKKGDFGYYTVAISKLMTQEEFQKEMEQYIEKVEGPKPDPWYKVIWNIFTEYIIYILVPFILIAAVYTLKIEKVKREERDK